MKYLARVKKLVIGTPPRMFGICVIISVCFSNLFAQNFRSDVRTNNEVPQLTGIKIADCPCGNKSGQIRFVEVIEGVDITEAYSLIQTLDDGYAITGRTLDFHPGYWWDVILCRLNSSGILEQTKVVGGDWRDYGASLIQTSDGGYAIAGLNTSPYAIGFKICLQKFNASANLEWAKVFGWYDYDYVTSPTSLIQTPDNKYVLAGYSHSFSSADLGMVLCQLNASGNIEWVTLLSRIDEGQDWPLIQTRDGGYIVAGSSWRQSPPYDEMILLCKFDPSGNLEWTRMFGGTSDEYAKSVIQTIDGGYAIAGKTASFGAGGSDIILCKFDSLGYLEWTRTVGGTGNECANSLIQTADGGYAITGWTGSFGTGGKDIILCKFDSLGDLEWTRAVGGTGDECANSLIQSADGGYAVTGWTESFGVVSRSIILCKFDFSGWSCMGDSANPIVNSPSLSSLSPSYSVYHDSPYYDFFLNQSVVSPMPGTTFVCYDYLAVIHPNGGEAFDPGDTCEIRWIAEDNVGVDSISLFFSINSGTSWDTIATGEPNDSLYEWIIPNTPSDSCLVKLLAYDPNLNIGEDQSDSLFRISSGVGIEENISSPVFFARLQIRPNPFSKTTVISFQCPVISEKEKITLSIYDLSGRLVKSFTLTTDHSALSTAVSWDGRNNLGKEVQSGVYFCRLSVGDQHLTKKLLRLQ